VSIGVERIQSTSEPTNYAENDAKLPFANLRLPVDAVLFGWDFDYSRVKE
jgi:hypothetical protein